MYIDSKRDGSLDANNNVKKDIKLTNGSNPFNPKPVDANVVNENYETPTRRRCRNSVFSNSNRENVSPNTSAKPKSRLAIKFPVKVDKNSDEFDEPKSLIDLCDNGDNSKSITNLPESTVLNESVSSNGNNPFNIKIDQLFEPEFDLENFKWSSAAGQRVVMAKKANNTNENDDDDDHYDDDDDDKSMMVMLSTSSESDPINPAVNVDKPVSEPRRFDRFYFVFCRECNNTVVASTWHTHMKRTHNQDVDPDCVPECPNDAMKAAFCTKCQNIMPRSAFKSHMNRKHRNGKMVGVIMHSGPDDDIFNRMLKAGKIFAKDGIIYFEIEQNNE